MNGIIQRVGFCIWLLSLSIMFSRVISVVAGISTFFGARCEVGVQCHFFLPVDTQVSQHHLSQRLFSLIFFICDSVFSLYVLPH